MNIPLFCLTFLALFILILIFFFFFQSRLLTSQVPVVMNSTVGYMVGGKRTPFSLFQTCYLIFSGSVLWFWSISSQISLFWDEQLLHRNYSVYLTVLTVLSSESFLLLNIQRLENQYCAHYSRE